MAAAGVSKRVRKVVSHISIEALFTIFQHDSWHFLNNLKMLTRVKVALSPRTLDRLCADLNLRWCVLPLPLLRCVLNELDARLQNSLSNKHENAVHDILHTTNDIAFWISSDAAPRLFDRNQATWAWCSKNAASWVDAVRAETTAEQVTSCSWVSALGTTELFYFVAQPICDSQALLWMAAQFENCLGNPEFVLAALGDRARYFVMLRKPELRPSAVVQLVRNRQEWLVGELRGPANAACDLWTQAQAKSLAYIYSEYWRESRFRDDEVTRCATPPA